MHIRPLYLILWQQSPSPMSKSTLLLLLACVALWGEEQRVSPDVAPSARPARTWTASLQTGFADTFQLTLGGTFGEGPAWQNRVSVALNNAFRAADSITLSGWNTHDTPSAHNDWTAYICYRARVLNRRNHVLLLGAGVERWRFPSVRTGTQDWLTAYNAAYTTRAAKLPVTVQSNAWTLLQSDLPKGSLVHTQVWLDHPIVKTDAARLTFRHGPQHTYSWNFYGTNGNRIVRYATALVLTSRNYALECGYRQQFGLQPGIPDNRYWNVMLTRSF